MEEGKKKRKALSASFVTGAIALVFLIIGYEVAVFIHKAAVTRIEANRDHPDTVYVYVDSGEDATEEDEGIVIYTSASDLMKVRKALVDNGLTVTSAELQYVPNNYVPVEGESAEKLEKLLGAIDDLDDVVNVYTNAE